MKREPEQENLGKNSPGVELKTDESKRDQEKVRCGFTTTERSFTALPIVPVKTRRKGTKEYVETYALLDGGSNSTFCRNSLSQCLGCIGKERKVKLTSSGTTEDVTTVILGDLEMSDLDENMIIALPHVLCRPNIPVSRDEIPIQDDVDHWPYLQRHVFLPNVDSNVEVLFRVNVPEALLPIRIIGSQNGGQYESKIALGWAINGPTGRKSATTQNASFFAKSEVHPVCEVCTDFVDTSEFNKEMPRDDLQFMSIVTSSVKKTNDNHYGILLPMEYSK